jgi:hypothetical protein
VILIAKIRVERTQKPESRIHIFIGKQDFMIFIAKNQETGVQNPDFLIGKQDFVIFIAKIREERIQILIGKQDFMNFVRKLAFTN